MEIKQHKNGMNAAAYRAVKVYNKPTLSLYDLFVLGFSNSFIWKCPTKLLLDFYNEHISLNHLDVGVGTGYFLDKCQFPISQQHPNIHLLDLNSNTLSFTAKRIKRYQPKMHMANIIEPLAIELPMFDSIGINYLLHTVPGSMQSKEIVFKNLISLLKPHGTLFGATILGKHIKPNLLAKTMMNFYNTKGYFNNTQDDLLGLKSILSRNFEKYAIKEHGCVAMFFGCQS